MSDTLSDLILSLVPEDGSSIGNGAMFALLEERVPGITREQYDAARDELIERGILGRGRGRGGSIYRADVAELSLEATEEPETKASGAKKPRKKASRKSGESAEVLSYRHADTRVNNPEVGMVHATTDPDGPPRVWKHDPHLSPELMFDIGRSYIEKPHRRRARLGRCRDHARRAGGTAPPAGALSELDRQGRAHELRGRYRFAACA
ncbi:hypothetical protein ACFOHS_13880 [Jhaorihella thermophila]